jgi:hypothetical protein
VDASGALYVSENSSRPGHRDRLLNRDADGHRSELATQGRDLDQVSSGAQVRVDSTGILYVGDDRAGIQKRDLNGTWTVVCAPSTEPGILSDTSCLAVDSHGSLYVVDSDRVQKRDPEGRWTVLAQVGREPDRFGLGHCDLVAAAPNGNIYVSGYCATVLRAAGFFLEPL